MNCIKTLLAGVATTAMFALNIEKASAQVYADYNIIPVPRSIQMTKGTFTLTPENRATAIRTKVDTNARRWAKDKISNEAYEINVTPKGIEICGASDEAVFRGMQTLRKAILLNDNAEETYVLPCVTIHDSPEFAYRGTHFDTSRHFFPVDFLKKYIDILALHGVNTFHWHITDDQGWRFEVKKHPKLTEIGQWRDGTMMNHDFSSNDHIRYGGYYTQEECREIVRYAAERYITVMPEIDLPGHMLGALAAYPELGCTGGPYKVWTKWGVAEEVLCAGNPKTLELIKDVLRELIDVFPSKMIHLGGDECPKNEWKKCPKCQDKIKQLGIVSHEGSTAEDQLQSWLMLEAERFLNENGREMIGWDEILDGGISPSTSIMSWRGKEGGIAAARSHHKVVMSPTAHCYINFCQSKDQGTEPLSFDAYLPLSQSYALQTVPSELNEDEAQYILGCQANLWTEYITSCNQAEHMLLPRLAAICEAQWMPQSSRNYNDFLHRLDRLTQYYKILGYEYCDKRE